MDDWWFFLLTGEESALDGDSRLCNYGSLTHLLLLGYRSACGELAAEGVRIVCGDAGMRDARCAH